KVPNEVSPWVHKGATSQDIMDSGLMLLSRITGAKILSVLDVFLEKLSPLRERYGNTVTVARTLTQHGVPTTWGARIAAWGHGVSRARYQLHQAINALPAQLAGAGGTLASFMEIAGKDRAARLPEVFASQLNLQPPAQIGRAARRETT